MIVQCFHRFLLPFLLFASDIPPSCKTIIKEGRSRLWLLVKRRLDGGIKNMDKWLIQGDDLTAPWAPHTWHRKRSTVDQGV